MHYTIRQLEVFLAIAWHENVSQAADALSMSQSAASASLKELEQRFDIQLFDRIGKRLQLNDFGKSLRPRAEALLAQAAEFENLLAERGEIGHIQVGATLTIGNYLAVPIMAEYMNRYPGSRVDLTVENTRAITQRVLNFELDVGLVEGEQQDDNLDVIPWYQDELALFCAPDHPLAGRPTLDDDDLRTADWIIREAGSGTRQGFEHAMYGLMPRINVRLELQHTEAIKRAVEAGLGIGCLSRITLQEAFRRGSLLPLYAPHRDWVRQFYFIIHKQKYRTAGIRNWLALCQEDGAGNFSHYGPDQ
ncbi:LysR family transcriptional regulator [Pseudohongiella sp. SYSU M77423]|uniref:LysR family transcriptional regulator n=1 Tax=unclassified Pseudohongiella TaxID=2629611 RepID=UPI000C96FC4B|nr:MULTISPECIES: LysR family transcriptional regulator [unclassified Pseudohongiella]MAY55854.1 LysR family transcriptional regulator [Gammaproteobacteria bacterium]MDH7943968.1 LysR family transcriptional regulator [Pseudohongiella sp. SYSU M77423]MEC8859033.1 LysR family transcriptional regulator [Pseudomonadota bacterium]|tara:strand:- start:779 stop:1693 length:915 start_codon:yes stop_codon:yes gene_type:complete